MSNDASAVESLPKEQNASTGILERSRGQWVEGVEPAIASVVEQSGLTVAKTGRPRKLTFTRVRRILRALADGTPQSYAPSCGGIDSHTWKDWCEQFPALSRLAARAMDIGVASTVREVRYGCDIKGNPDWKARAWLLERRHKEHFAAPKASETTVNVNTTNNVLNVDAASLAALADAYARMQQQSAVSTPEPKQIGEANR